MMPLATRPQLSTIERVSSILRIVIHSPPIGFEAFTQGGSQSSKLLSPEAGSVSPELTINFAAIAHFQGDFAFGVGVIEMGNGFRDREETVDIVGIGKHLARDFPGRGAALRHQTQNGPLAFVDGA